MDRLAMLLIALAILSGCGGRQPAAAEDPSLELERMAGDFPRLVGAARCENVAQCRYIGIGAKSCGGPWDYLIYSILGTDTDLLESRVKHYNRLQAEANRRSGAVSPCTIPPLPVLGCLDGRCVDVTNVPTP
jgi:hypothetical protein